MSSELTEGQEWTHCALSKLYWHKQHWGRNGKRNRQAEVSNAESCSSHCRMSDTQVNPNTLQPHPNWSLNYYSQLLLLGFLLLEFLSILSEASINSLTLCKRSFFVSSSVFKSGFLLPCDLRFSLAEWVFGWWKELEVSCVTQSPRPSRKCVSN